MPHGRTYPPEIVAKYPHMFPRDIEVWERFLKLYGTFYLQISYDVKVGEPTLLFPHWETQYRHDAQELSKLRIDAVGEREDRIDIIEVKPKFSSSAIGQVLTYKDAYLKDFGSISAKPIWAVIVAGEADPNTLKTAEKFGISYFQV